MSEEKRERLWTIANFFSILRVLFIPLFLHLLIHQKAFEALVVFFVASATDVLDGMAARLWDQQTKIGGLLDPAADKLLMTASIIVLSIEPVSRPNTIPLWLAATIISRDLTISIGAYVLYKIRGQKTFPPSIWGKASTVCQMGLVLLVLLLNALQTSPPLMIWVYGLTMFLTVISGIYYGQWGCRLLFRPRS